MSSDENHLPPHEPSHKHVFALCNYPALLTSGILRLEELQDIPVEDYPAEVFMELVDSYPSLLERLTNGEEEDIILVGELVSTGQMQRPSRVSRVVKSQSMVTNG
ncbi:hypothetical protein BDR04DRAFT_1120626 [Suillus decipiens]|nr:hypothetical protein BDR04DRAFT_1120626 [Suillus decipiens]